ncbi:MAG: YifB family Mg chelatase-like AAA ATPase [Rickettsiales bacterium]|nr:YifB family Mg chelatase-like AAA ATPase [Rickettsiales bacterium]
MSVCVRTVAFHGIDVTDVEVQVQLSSGLPGFALVGLPDKAVAESRERVRAAIHSMGLALPAKRIVVNLAPADLAKEGSHFDLPIACALLVAMGVLPPDAVDDFLVMGELSLDGRILPVSGVLPAAMGATARGLGLICPAACGSEARWAGDFSLLAPDSLLAFINHVKGTQVLSLPQIATQTASVPRVDMAHIKGQHAARRALEIAAAGGHNLLMSGPPGTGKSMLASALPGILPPMSAQEMLEVSMIASVAGTLPDGGLMRQRPFRDPHHSASLAAMVGGGKRAKPGEISLAHHGVLFLDELPEFPRAALEALRQPLESGTVSIARALAHITYPARFQLIAAMNPCRCGHLGDATLACSKAPRCGSEYQSRLSGPFLDRIDLTIEMPMIDTLDMMARPMGEPTATVAVRVAAARARQTERYEGSPNVHINALADSTLLEQHARPDAAGLALLEEAASKFRLSMRGYTRMLRVARTIADIEGVAHVLRPHIAEALSYRSFIHGQHLQAA